MPLSFCILVHVDIGLTTYLPYVDNRGHLTDHLPTLSCPRSLRTTPKHRLQKGYDFIVVIGYLLFSHVE